MCFPNNSMRPKDALERRDRERENKLCWQLSVGVGRTLGFWVRVLTHPEFGVTQASIVMVVLGKRKGSVERESPKYLLQGNYKLIQKRKKQMLLGQKRNPGSEQILSYWG